MAVAIEKHIAASWKGGTSPEEAVRRASSDHIRIALNPISVACINTFFHCPNVGPKGSGNCLGCGNRGHSHMYTKQPIRVARISQIVFSHGILGHGVLNHGFHKDVAAGFGILLVEVYFVIERLKEVLRRCILVSLNDVVLLCCSFALTH